MKAMVCEMCSGNDFVKDGDFFVCQSCGTKYTVEAAKKLMIEGTVDVKGTEKVDNSQFVEKQLENARRAFAKEDWEEVEKYYNMVEQYSSSNMEAVFFSSFGKAMLSLTDNETFKREQIFKVLVNSMSVISDYYEVTTENKEWVLGFIASAIEKMYSLTFVESGIIDTTSFLTTLATVEGPGSAKWQMNLYNAVKNAFIIELNQISEKHNDPFLQELQNRMKTGVGIQLNPCLKRYAKTTKSFTGNFWITLGGIVVGFIIFILIVGTLINL